MKKSSGNIFKILLIAAMIVVPVVAVMLFDLRQVMHRLLMGISGLGVIGPIVFTGLYILACVLLIPGSILTLGAGVVFGVITGSIAVSIGSTLGATCAFLIGRYLARDLVASRIAGDEKFKAIDEAVGREGWKIVLLLRLSPVFPFNLLNYALGLTKVSLRHYLVSSWLGMMPGTVLYVYIGSLAGDLAGLGGGGHTRTMGEWILYGIGLPATIAVAVFVARLARKALSARISL